MGLDQYWTVEHSNPKGSDEATTAEQFMYHRKVPSLQDFMEQEWRSGDDATTDAGLPRDFNCVPVVITTEILDRLECALKNNGEGLNKNATGFFYGQHYDEDIADIEKAIGLARTYLAIGEKVIYDSWW